MHIYGIGLDMNINEVMYINETSLPPVPPAPPPSGLPAYWPSSLRVYKDLPLTAFILVSDVEACTSCASVEQICRLRTSSPVDFIVRK